jgi:hypothetical protein
MHRLSTEYYKEKAHLQFVDVIASRKIAFVEDERLETDVRSESSVVGEVDRHESLRGHSVGKDPIVVLYRVTLSTVIVTKLKLLNLHCLMSVSP